MDELERALGAAVPEHFSELATEDRSALAGLVRQAVQDRSDLIDHAIDDSLRYLPGLLRGAVKRALGM